MDDHLRLHKPWVGQIFHSNFNSKSRGTAILIYKRVKFTPDHIHCDPDGQYVIVSGMLFQTPVVLANVYAPNWDSPNFMSTFFSHLPNLDTHKLILGGDFNCVTNPAIDRSHSKSVTPTVMSLSASMDQLG